METAAKIFLGLIIAFMILSMIIEFRDNNKCEAVGGLVITGYGWDNCWKDGQFVNVK